MVEIYFGLTEKHINNFENIIKYESKDEKKIQRILITDKNTHNSKLWDRIIFSDVIFLQKGKNTFQDLSFMIKKIRSYKKIINKLKVYKNESGVRIYLAYIEDILSNYLFFHFYEKPEVIIVEDGILNYYEHTFNDVSKVRFYIKKTLSRLFNIKYSKYKGHSSGIDYPCSKMQYLSFPDQAYVPKKAHLLPKEQVLVNEPNNYLYIIGQENLIQIIGINNYKLKFFEFIDELKEYLSTSEVDTIFYKPRNKCFEFELEYMEQTFNNFKFEVLNNRLLAEEDYFKNIRSRYVASMISSALLTIYSILSDDTKQHFEFIYKPIMDSRMSKLFEKLKFTKLDK